MTDFESKLRVAIDARRAKKGAKEVEQALERVARDADRADNRIEKFQGGLNRLGGVGAMVKSQIGGLFAVAVGGGAIAGTTALLADFEKTLLTVGGVAGASSEELLRLEEVARRLGATTSFSANEAGQGLLFLARAGFSVEESIQALPATLNLAIAGNFDLARAADIASNVVQQFGVGAAGSAEAVDILALAANSANTDVEQLSQGLKFVGPTAAALGKDLAETAAAIGALSDAGIQGSLAGTNLRGILANLLKPTSQAEEAFRKLEVSLEDVNPRTRSLQEVFQTLSDAGLDAQTGIEIFGRELSSAALVLADSAGKVGELTERFQDSEGTAEELAGTIGSGLSGSLKSLISATQEAALQLGDSGLGDAMKFATDSATDTIRVLTGMDDTLQRSRVAAEGFAFAVQTGTVALGGFTAIKVGSFLLGAAGAFQLVTGATGALTVATTANTVALSAQGAALKANGLLASQSLARGFGVATAATRGLTAALLANPLILGVTGISAAAVGLRNFVREIEETENAWTRAISGMNDAVVVVQQADESMEEAQQRAQSLASARGMDTSTVIKNVATQLRELGGSFQDLQRSSDLAEALGDPKKFNRQVQDRIDVLEEMFELFDWRTNENLRATSRQPIPLDTIIPLVTTDEARQQIEDYGDELVAEATKVVLRFRDETGRLVRSEDVIDLVPGFNFDPAKDADFEANLQRRLNLAQDLVDAFTEDLAGTGQTVELGSFINPAADAARFLDSNTEEAIALPFTFVKKIIQEETLALRNQLIEAEEEVKKTAEQLKFDDLFEGFRTELGLRRSLIGLTDDQREIEETLFKFREQAEASGIENIEDRLAGLGEELRAVLDLEAAERKRAEAAQALEGLIATQENLQTRLNILRSFPEEQAGIETELARIQQSVADLNIENKDAEIAKIRELLVAIEDEKQARREAKEAADAQAQIDELFNVLQEERNLIGLSTEERRESVEMRRLERLAVQAGITDTEALLDRYREELALIRQLTDDYEAKQEAVREAERAIQRSNDARNDIQVVLDGLRNEASLIGLTNDERERAIQLAQFQSDLAKVNEDDLAALGGSVSELTGRYAELLEQVELAREIREVGDALGESIAGGLEDVILGAKNAKDAVRDFADELIRLVLQKSFTEPLAESISGIFTGLAGAGAAGGQAGGNPFGAFFAGLFGGGQVASEDGNLFTGGRVVPFASGGIVDTPTFFPLNGGTGLAGEAGPEAILPLKRGSDGKLGVRTEGGAGKTININLTQNIQSPDVNGFRRNQAAVARDTKSTLDRALRDL